MDKKSDILTRNNRHSGMTVPEGYFADFVSRMEQTLPEKSQLAPAELHPRTFWQKVRPYAYMAAMFAGIWCMLKMFTMMGGGSADLSIENYKGVTTALTDEHFVKDYVVPDVDDYDFYEDLYNQDEFTPDEFFDFEYSESGSDNNTDLNGIQLPD